jgi:hypothetical protein
MAVLSGRLEAWREDISRRRSERARVFREVVRGDGRSTVNEVMTVKRDSEGVDPRVK